MKILKYPNRSLTTPTIEIDFNDLGDSDVPSLVETMKLMLAEQHNGLALAANQVGLPWKLFVVRSDFAAANNIANVIVNPKYVGIEDEVADREGCLSFPGVNLLISRYAAIACSYFNMQGEQFSCQLNGLVARMFQHECEHLEGKLFTDNVDRITRYQVYGVMRKR